MNAVPGELNMPSSARAGSPQLYLVLAIVLLVCLFHLNGSLASMVAIWDHDGFGHGYIIPLVSAFLLWRNRGALAEAPIQPSWLGLVVVVASIWLWLLSRQTLIQLGEHVALLGMIHGAVIAVLGFAAYRAVAFALWYLFLAVPAGFSTVPWLMELTADLSQIGLQLLGIPALREQMFFMLPGGNFEVAEACSGFRFVFSGVALTALVAYLDLPTWKSRAVFVAFSVVCFVLLNSIRATLIMAIASATDMRHLATNHEWFGWLLFALVFALLCLLAQRLSHAPATP